MMKKDEKEIRCLNIKDLNLRVTRKDDGSLPKIEGYAAVFDSNSEDMGFIERIAPGAFKDALKRSDARALFNHNPDYVLGRMSAGTLTLREDKKGLFMSVTPPDTQTIRDLVLSPIERGDINQQSFGFTIEADRWDNLDTDKPSRTILKVRELYDVSPVTYPAYQDTTVALRSLERAKQESPPAPESTVSVIIDGEQFVFIGDDRFDLAADKINSMRSLPSPSAAGDDNAGPEPTLTDGNDVAKDDLLETINKTIERLK
jgi:HK97 family phage prohead protease